MQAEILSVDGYDASGPLGDEIGTWWERESERLREMQARRNGYGRQRAKVSRRAFVRAWNAAQRTQNFAPFARRYHRYIQMPYEVRGVEDAYGYDDTAAPSTWVSHEDVQGVEDAYGYDDTSDPEAGWNLFKAIGGAISSVAKAVGGAVGKAAKWVGGAVKSGVNWIREHDPIGHFAMGILRGERIDKAFLSAGRLAIQTVKELAPIVQTVLSLIPGIGQGLSSALAAGIALASGQPISEAMVAAALAAIPGGALVQKIAKSAIPAIQAIASGQRLDRALMEAARAQLPGQAAKAAFDGAMALASGKSIQEAAAKAVGGLGGAAAKAGTWAQRALSVGQKLLDGQRLDKAVFSAAMNVVQTNPNFKRLENLANKTVAKVAAPILRAQQQVQSLTRNVQGQATQFASRALSPVFQAQNQAQSLARTFGSAVPYSPMGNLNAVRWRPMSQGILSQLLQRSSALRNMPIDRLRAYTLAPNAREASGLEGSVYIVDPGDGPWAIAKKVTGNGARWKELVAANPKKKTRPDGNFVSLQPKERLELPASWIGIVATPNAPSLPATPISTAPTAVAVGGTYVVKKGDFPWKIAQTFTGKGSRWKELIAANPNKKRKADGDFASLQPGEVLQLPATWGTPSPASVPDSPLPTMVPISFPGASPSVARPDPRIGQVQTILVAWDAKQTYQSGYGSMPGDLSGVWNERTKAVCSRFQTTQNVTRNLKLRTDGILDDATYQALIDWSSQLLGLPVPSIPSIPIGLPPVQRDIPRDEPPPLQAPESVIFGTPPRAAPQRPANDVADRTAATTSSGGGGAALGLAAAAAVALLVFARK